MSTHLSGAGFKYVFVLVFFTFWCMMEDIWRKLNIAFLSIYVYCESGADEKKLAEEHVNR